MTSHDMLSFGFTKLLMESVLDTVAAAVGESRPITEPVVAALNTQRQSLHQHIRQLFPGSSIDLLHGGPGNFHALATLLLGESLSINETDALIFVNSQRNALKRCIHFHRYKARCVWHLTHTPAFSGSCDRKHLLISSDERNSLWLSIPYLWHMSIIIFSIY